jgi:hypothetical protein
MAANHPLIYPLRIFGFIAFALGAAEVRQSSVQKNIVSLFIFSRLVLVPRFGRF